MNMLLPAWAKYLAIAAAALALYAFGRLDGARIEGAKHADYVAQQAGRAVRIIQAQQKVSTDVQIHYVERIKVIKEKGDVVIKEVPVYITAETDRRFPVPGGFVRVHDAAARGEPAGTPADSDGEASAVTASAAAETIAANYADCRRYAEQVTGWQEFYQRLSQTANIP